MRSLHLSRVLPKFPAIDHRARARQDSAASISSGVNRCTHRYTLTWPTMMPFGQQFVHVVVREAVPQGPHHITTMIKSGGKWSPANRTVAEVLNKCGQRTTAALDHGSTEQVP